MSSLLRSSGTHSSIKYLLSFCKVKEYKSSWYYNVLISIYYRNSKLRGNPPNVWVTSEQKLCTKITFIYITYKHHVTVLNNFSKEIISNNINCQKQILNFVWNTWKYWWNETDKILPVFAQYYIHVYLNFEIYFKEFQWKIVFGVISGNHLYVFCFYTMHKGLSHTQRT